MLAGIRVLDLTDETGFLAGKILGDLGADVVKVEPPGGDPARRRAPFLGGVDDPERSLLWLALNTSKRGVTLDLDCDDGRERLRAMVRRADVVLESARPGAMDARGIGYLSLKRDNARIVYCAMSAFGQTGPLAGYRGRDLVVVAMGGNAYATGDPDRPPVRCTMPTAYYHAAPEAALGVTMALYAREETGLGQLVDISLHECQLQSLLSFPGQYEKTKRLSRRLGPRIGRTREIWRTKDGYVTFGLRGGPSRIRNIVAMVDYMGACKAAPQWLEEVDWQRYDHNALGAEEIRRFEDAFAAFFRHKTMRELYDAALERRILLAPCNDAREILEHPQLRDRRLFVTIDYPELGAALEHPGFFARFGSGDDGIRIRRRAPRIGEHNEEIFAELQGAP